MNYFAHGWKHVGEPYFLAGTAIPDWLCVVDRRVRVTSKLARPFVSAPDPLLASVAAGIVAHHRDDERFHRAAAFAELSIRFSREIRALLPGDESLRPSFLGHILVEILLDAELIAGHPERLADYYQALESLDPRVVNEAVNRIAKTPTPLLAAFLPRFIAERFLYDYADDGKLLVRLNHVMRRVGLKPLPETFCGLLPAARADVRQHVPDLLDGHAADKALVGTCLARPTTNDAIPDDNSQGAF